MQQGDIGAPVRFELRDGLNPFALPTGARVELWIRQPSQRVLVREFEITDAALGKVYYETAAGDLAEFGLYRFQARAILLDGSRVAFSPVDDEVGRNVFPATVYVLPSPAVASLGALEVAPS